MTAGQIGLALYTVSGQMKTAADCARTLARARQIGYERVEISFPLPFPDFAAQLADQGLNVIDMHVGLTEFRARPAEVGETARRLQCRHLTVPWVDPASLPTAAAWQALAHELSALGKRFADQGLALQYHNHHFEFHRFAGKSGLEILYAESDPRYLKAQLDTHWVARGGGDPADWIRRMRGRTEQVHCKDLVMLDGNPVFADVGHGNLNWPEIFKAGREAGIQDYIVEEDPGGHMPDPFQSIQNSLSFLSNCDLCPET